MADAAQDPTPSSAPTPGPGASSPAPASPAPAPAHVRPEGTIEDERSPWTTSLVLLAAVAGLGLWAYFGEGSAPPPRPDGLIESLDVHVEPRSLYRAQLEARLPSDSSGQPAARM